MYFGVAISNKHEKSAKNINNIMTFARNTNNNLFKTILTTCQHILHLQEAYGEIKAKATFCNKNVAIKFGIYINKMLPKTIIEKSLKKTPKAHPANIPKIENTK